MVNGNGQPLLGTSISSCSASTGIVLQSTTACSSHCSVIIFEIFLEAVVKNSSPFKSKFCKIVITGLCLIIFQLSVQQKVGPLITRNKCVVFNDRRTKEISGKMVCGKSCNKSHIYSNKQLNEFHCSLLLRAIKMLKKLKYLKKLL